MYASNKKGLRIFLIIPAILVVLLIGYMVGNNNTAKYSLSDLLSGRYLFDDYYADDYADEYDEYDYDDDEFDYATEVENNFFVLEPEEFIGLFNSKSEDADIVFIGSETCVHCQEYLPEFISAQDEYGFNNYYLGMEDIEQKYSETIKKLDKYLEEHFGTTPLLIAIKDGKVVDALEGYKTSDEVLEFLEKNA